MTFTIYNPSKYYLRALKARLLATHLNVTFSEATQLLIERTYKILTIEEAKQELKDYIKEDLCNLVPFDIIQYTVGDPLEQVTETEFNNMRDETGLDSMNRLVKGLLNNDLSELMNNLIIKADGYAYLCPYDSKYVKRQIGFNDDDDTRNYLGNLVLIIQIDEYAPDYEDAEFHQALKETTNCFAPPSELLSKGIYHIYDETDFKTNTFDWLNNCLLYQDIEILQELLPNSVGSIKKEQDWDEFVKHTNPSTFYQLVKFEIETKTSVVHWEKLATESKGQISKAYLESKEPQYYVVQQKEFKVEVA